MYEHYILQIIDIATAYVTFVHNVQQYVFLHKKARFLQNNLTKNVTLYVTLAVICKLNMQIVKNIMLYGTDDFKYITYSVMFYYLCFVLYITIHYNQRYV
jgi:hypothetical protein